MSAAPNLAMSTAEAMAPPVGSRAGQATSYALTTESTVDEEGEWILPSSGELTPAGIARAIAGRLNRLGIPSFSLPGEA